MLLVNSSSCSRGLGILLKVSRFPFSGVSSTTLHGFTAPSVRASASQAELRTDEVGGRAQFKSAYQNSVALRSSSVQEFDMEAQKNRSARQWCCNGVVVSGRAGCAARFWLDPLSTRSRTLTSVCLRALFLPVLRYLTLCYACTVCDRRRWMHVLWSQYQRAGAARR